MMLGEFKNIIKELEESNKVTDDSEICVAGFPIDVHVEKLKAFNDGQYIRICIIKKGNGLTERIG